MCFFGDPESKGVKADAEACVRMALEMQEQLHVMQTGWRRQGVIDRPFQARMGINTGYCTVGNFGSQDRMDYTIIGHEVNLAARLESHADPGGILMAAETYSLVEEWLLAVEQDAITMKGFAQPVRIFQVSGTMADLEDGGSLIRHEDDGVRITIDKETADKSKTIAALERALADLNSEISK
jgi:class 3 adenylate cyclase